MQWVAPKKPGLHLSQQAHYTNVPVIGWARRGATDDHRSGLVFLQEFRASKCRKGDKRGDK
jgi:hypothetical protein